MRVDVYVTASQLILQDLSILSPYRRLNIYLTSSRREAMVQSIVFTSVHLLADSPSIRRHDFASVLITRYQTKIQNRIKYRLRS